jgi:hypothetical protein
VLRTSLQDIGLVPGLQTELTGEVEATTKCGLLTGLHYPSNPNTSRDEFMKKADRDLLHLAGKAAGKYFDPTVRHPDGLLVIREGTRDQDDLVVWNPLKNDNDLLQLMTCKLIQLTQTSAGVHAVDMVRGVETFDIITNHKSRLAATRYVVVKLFAEPGMSS